MSASIWITFEILSKATGIHSNIIRTAPYCKVQPKGSLNNLPFSCCSLWLQETTGGLLFLCVSLKPSSSAVSQEEIHKSITFISRDENGSQGVRKVCFPASVKVCHIVKNGKKIKKKKREDAQQCYSSSLMKENERSCRFLSPTARHNLITVWWWWHYFLTSNWNNCV